MNKMSYLPFDLLMTRHDYHYCARLLTSPVGQATNNFVVPFADEDLLHDGQLLTAFGAELFKAIFNGELLSSYRRSLDLAKQQGYRGIRILLRLADVPELSSIPWQYLYDESRQRFICLSSETSLAHYLDLSESEKPLLIEPPLKILTLLSNPDGYPSLDVEQEWQNLNEALGELVKKGLVTVTRLEQATLPALHQCLMEEAYHIFHFVGHGFFDEEAERGMLILQNEDGSENPVSAVMLGNLLHDKSLRLVLLNACQAGSTSTKNAFAGVAATLVQQGIPAVVAMQSSITDEAAIAFAKQFYRQLAANYPVDAAITEARRAIYYQGNLTEWGTPMLYMRAPDGQLFNIKAKSERHDKGGGASTSGFSGGKVLPQPATPQKAPLQQPSPHHTSSITVAIEEYEPEMRELAEKLTQQRLILFLGADLPASITGIESRHTIAEKLAARYKIEPSKPLGTVAQLVMSRGNRHDFTRFLMDRLVSSNPSPFYDLIAQLIKKAAPEWIITTAYHRLLERSLEGYQCPFNTVVNDNNLFFINANQPTLLKFYGDIQQPTSLVVTEQDQSQLLRGRFPDKGDMVDEIRRLFRRHSILFIGYDLSDPSVSVFFDEVATHSFQSSSVAVLSGLSPQEINSFQSNRGLKILAAEPIAVIQRLLQLVG